MGARGSSGRRAGLGGLGAAAALLLVASAAWACTGISPGVPPSGHYLEVTPSVGPAALVYSSTGVPVTVSGYLLNTCSAADPCAPSGSGQLHRSAPLSGAAVVDIVSEPVLGVHNVSDCGPGAAGSAVIGNVDWVTEGNQLAVTGSGSMRDLGGSNIALYRVCADPEPDLLWNYFVVV